MRQHTLIIMAALAATQLLPMLPVLGDPVKDKKADMIPALMPRGKPGHQFLIYSDSVSGDVSGSFSASLKAVNDMATRIRPRPEFLSFPGDPVFGCTTNYKAMRKEWDVFYNKETTWPKENGVPIFMSTSNHICYDDGSEAVFREVHPDLPQNGPAGEKGLAWYKRHGDILYISMHQPDRVWSAGTKIPQRKDMVFDGKWVDKVLTKHRDARFKFVVGHYPVFPVNGVTGGPAWCFKPEERQPFWDVLVKHKVDAYIGAHVLAFDVQIHQGIPQIISAGGGCTVFMPAYTEYLHATQLAIDTQGLRLQVIDTKGKVREKLTWPFKLPGSARWKSMKTKTPIQAAAGAPGISVWRFLGKLGKDTRTAQTLVAGLPDKKKRASVWIGFEGGRLTVRLNGPEHRTWVGPKFKANARFYFQVAIHAGLGPGGVMYRKTDAAPWQSLTSTSPSGVDRITWPAQWIAGVMPDSKSKPFKGTNLKVRRIRIALPDVSP